MRPVKYKQYKKAEYTDTAKLIEGTGCLDSDFIHDGTFIKWGLDCCQEGTYSIAIVELENGTIIKILPELLKFNDKNK